ncbi:MAG: hypothetical protein WCA51_00840 [Dehalococcoidia bacterium]
MVGLRAFRHNELMAEVAAIVGGRRVSYRSLIVLDGDLAFGGKAAAAQRDLGADVGMLGFKAYRRADIKAGDDISEGHIFHGRLELVIAGDGIGDGELGAEAAQLIGGDGKLGICAIEAQLNVFLFREAGAFDGGFATGCA